MAFPGLALWRQEEEDVSTPCCLGPVFTSSISDLTCFLKPKIEQNGSFCAFKKIYFFPLQLFRYQ